MFKGTDYLWRKCTTSKEGDPFKAPDSKSELALRFPLENATRVNEVQFDFNEDYAQIAELEFDFVYYNVDDTCSFELTQSMSLMSQNSTFVQDGVQFTGKN